MTDIKYPEITVKLKGENGNVFNLIGLCVLAMKRNGLDSEEIGLFEAEVDKCQSYTEVLGLMMEWFNIE